VGRNNDVTAWVYSLPHICEALPSHRFSSGRLVFKGGDSIQATGTHKNRRPQKAAAWMKAPVSFPDAFATDAPALL
jgi:hypothetical protein